MKIFSDSVPFMQPLHTVPVRFLIFSAAVTVLSFWGIFFLPAPASAQGPEATPSQPASSLSSPSLESLTPEQLERGKEMLQQRQSEAQPPIVSTEAKEKAEPGEPSLPSSETELSPFEAYIQGKHPQAISLDIRQFGYDLFERPATTFAPVDIVPVGPDYLLGPGDELRINVWGQVNADHVVVLDRDGKINLPQIGPLHLAGLTFSEAKRFIRKEFSRLYKPSEVKLNISMGRLRSIRIFVVGKAKRPGSYTLSSFSTLINALFAAGGPSKVGTMRDIRVKRGGKTIVRFDLYDFLLKGDKGKDIRLMPEDVIFIPTIGSLVGIAGNVRSPAIYELKGETGLRDLITVAGGINATGYLHRVQLERVFENKAKVVLDVNLEELEKKGRIPLKDGDIVKVFSINQAVTNPVELVGNLIRPGTYQWREGLKIKDLIKSTEDLLPDTFMDFALIERRVPPDYHKEYFSTGLGKLLLDGDERQNIILEPNDTIVVFNRRDLVAKEAVRIWGAVNKPGEFEYRPNMTLSDLLRLAGGLKREAFSLEAEMTRVTPTLEGPLTEKIMVNPEKALEGDPQYDLPLEEDDYLFVRTVPEWTLYRTVQIEGEVRFPGTYTIQKGESLSSLIARAGGFTDKAYLKGTVFTRESVRRLQQRQLDEAIDRLEQQLLSQSAKTIETALSPEAAAQEKAVMGQKKALIGKMRAAKAKGRIALHLDPLETFKGAPSDLVLEDGDRIIIPERPQQIQVIGAVYNQTAFIFDSDLKVSRYLRNAGGMTEEAEEDNLYILKVDGSAVSRRQGGFGWGGIMSSRLDPGDTIVVPEKIERISYLREAKDITQILFQIATTAGVLIVAF
ncbi:MAG: SLBB domain-containing protein [Nitrospiria bacterium]